MLSAAERARGEGIISPRKAEEREREKKKPIILWARLRSSVRPTAHAEKRELALCFAVSGRPFSRAEEERRQGKREEEEEEEEEEEGWALCSAPVDWRPWVDCAPSTSRGAEQARSEL